MPDYVEEVSIYLSWVPPNHAHAARAALEGLVAERDRYRTALERIYQAGRGLHVEVAREALNDA